MLCEVKESYENIYLMREKTADQKFQLAVGSVINLSGLVSLIPGECYRPFNLEKSVEHGFCGKSGRKRQGIARR